MAATEDLATATEGGEATVDPTHSNYFVVARSMSEQEIIARELTGGFCRISRRKAVVLLITLIAFIGAIVAVVMLEMPKAPALQAHEGVDGQVRATHNDSDNQTGIHLILLPKPKNSDDHKDIQTNNNKTFPTESRHQFKMFPYGTCASFGMSPIQNKNTCQTAARHVGIQDKWAFMNSSNRPHGCFYFREPPVPGGVVVQPICQRRMTLSSVQASPTSQKISTSTLTFTTTSTQTFTATTSTEGWPSLFCFCVARSHGYEAELVKQQLGRRASIFGCNDFTVFSHGGGIDLGGGWITGEIVVDDIKMGRGWKYEEKTTSWLNTKIFIKAWEMVQWDGRYQKHDWTVKVDPDTVFFPGRLRNVVRPNTPVGGSGVFFMNCDRYGSISLFGSLEIFSKEALRAYYNSTSQCQSQLNWHGWGEDLYMQKCMVSLGVGTINDFTLVGDYRCHGAPCSDTTKVAFHDFKKVQTWWDCWDASTRAAAGKIISS